MKRSLSGDLKHLAAPTLLRVLSTTTPSGVLELDTEAGELRLEIVRGRVPAASDTELEQAGRVLACSEGTFRFEPGEPEAGDGITLPLAAYAEAALTWAERRSSSISSEVELERLMAGDLIDFSHLDPASTNIHVLPEAPLENPLDDLLSDLESNAPGELLFAQVGVLAADPRPWRGPLEIDWRRRGWKLRHYAAPADAPLHELDALVVHQRLTMSRQNQVERLTEVVRRAQWETPPVPVIWVGPLADLAWVYGLVEGGVAYLMPTPHAETGETVQRFLSCLSAVVDRQLGLRQRLIEPELPDSLSALVESLVGEGGPEQAVASLLQIAAGTLLRGAILKVEDTAIRCRAGFGYPLSRRDVALPRGVGLLERVIRAREPLFGIDPATAGSRELARVLGISSLPNETAVLPLGTGTAVRGVLIADREGQPLPNLDQLVQLVCRLGGMALQD